MEGWELAAWLSIVLGVIYLLVEVLSGDWGRRGTASKILTLELGAYLTTVGTLVVLLGRGTVSPNSLRRCCVGVLSDAGSAFAIRPSKK